MKTLARITTALILAAPIVRTEQAQGPASHHLEGDVGSVTNERPDKTASISASTRVDDAGGARGHRGSPRGRCHRILVADFPTKPGETCFWRYSRAVSSSSGPGREPLGMMEGVDESSTRRSSSGIAGVELERLGLFARIPTPAIATLRSRSMRPL